MSEAAAAAKKEKAMAKYESAKAAEKAALGKAMAAEQAAEAAGFNDANLNATAKDEIAAWRDAHLKASKAKKKTKVKAYNQIGYLIGLGVFFAIFFGVGMVVMGESFHQVRDRFCLRVSGGHCGVCSSQPGDHETIWHRLCRVGHRVRHPDQ